MTKIPSISTPVVQQPTTTKATTTDEATKSAPKGVGSTSTSTISSAPKTEESKESSSRVNAFFQKVKAGLSSTLDTVLNAMKNFAAKVKEFFFGKAKEGSIETVGFGEGIETVFTEINPSKEELGRKFQAGLDKKHNLAKEAHKQAEAQRAAEKKAPHAAEKELDFGDGIETLFTENESDKSKELVAKFEARKAAKEAHDQVKAERRAAWKAQEETRVASFVDNLFSGESEASGKEEEVKREREAIEAMIGQPCKAADGTQAGIIVRPYMDKGEHKGWILDNRQVFNFHGELLGRLRDPAPVNG